MLAGVVDARGAGRRREDGRGRCGGRASAGLCLGASGGRGRGEEHGRGGRRSSQAGEEEAGGGESEGSRRRGEPRGRGEVKGPATVGEGPERRKRGRTPAEEGELAGGEKGPRPRGWVLEAEEEDGRERGHASGGGREGGDGARVGVRGGGYWVGPKDVGPGGQRGVDRVGGLCVLRACVGGVWAVGWTEVGKGVGLGGGLG